jgi:tetratricopeptide (TPR) repeat protein
MHSRSCTVSSMNLMCLLETHLSRDYNRYTMLRPACVLLFACSLAVPTLAQQQSTAGPGQNEDRARSADHSRESGESSSRDTRIDLSPPRNDAKDHPFSGAAISDATESDNSPDTSDVQEMHPWDPHKALKDIEVGDFYFKRKNYKAAMDRYREALFYKDNDAIANFRLAQCLEKFNRPAEARQHYQQYLKILPHGPLSEQAHKALERLDASQVAPNSASAKTEKR